MSSAYGVFATDGTRYPPISVLQIKDHSGNIIEDNTQPTGTQVLPPTIAEKINDILSDPVARAPLGENDLVQFAGHDVAVKTGTTNNYRDAWTIGYTPNLVVGIWAGNNDNSSMVKKVSGFIVGPMWHDFMQYALQKTPNNAFTRSEDTDPTVKPSLRGIWQVPGSDGSIHEILYWVDKNDPTGPSPANPAQDPQFNFWDIPVRAWAQTNNNGNSLPTQGQ
jgi:membrane peptidoglycan carboxypeptidase